MSCAPAAAAVSSGSPAGSGGHFLPSACSPPTQPPFGEPLCPWRSLPFTHALHRTAYQFPEPTMQTFLPAMVRLLASVPQRVWAVSI